MKDFPDYKFKKDRVSRWNYELNTVFYEQNLDQFLHELGHALLRHKDYETDLDLIKKERAAWTKAEIIAARYDHKIKAETIEAHLDTYRDWLHLRSTCPKCHQTGVENPQTGIYSCFICGTKWRTSKTCLTNLRRKII
jgi:ribosomal protein L37AE/L43A